MKYLFWIITAAASGSLGWFVYNQSIEESKTQAEAKETRPVAVEVTRVRRKAIEDRIDLVGTLEASREVEIRSRIAGYIKQLPFDVGDRVAIDKPVVVLDDSTNQELVSRSQAALKVAEAQLKSQRAKEALAAKEVARQKKLAESGVSTEQEQEAAAAQLEIAKAEVELELARVEEARSDLERSQLSLKDTRIHSPLAGVVAERFADVGNLAKPDTALLRIVDLSVIHTTVHVVERDYQKVKVGQTATIHVDAFPEKSFSGSVVRMAPVLKLETRTADVHINIENVNGQLKPGMHARVTIVFGKQDKAEVVPVASVIEHNDKTALYVVSGNPPRSKLQEVETGISDGHAVEIISGVDQDDRVVTLGSRLLRHGQSITPVEVPWSEAIAREEDADGTKKSASTAE